MKASTSHEVRDCAVECGVSVDARSIPTRDHPSVLVEELDLHHPQVRDGFGRRFGDREESPFSWNSYAVFNASQGEPLAFLGGQGP